MKIALLGYGIEAESAYKYFSKKYPDAKFVIYESKPNTKKPLPEGIEFHGGVKSFNDIEADIAVRTPAINPKKINVSGKVTSVTKLFFENCPAPIIGVTGTKGKGTTASLISEILKVAGKKVWLVGNIGEPALNILDEVQPEDIIVYELSSFQLWDLAISPHVAVVLMVEPEHLDVHENNEDYVQAKGSIARFQSVEDSVIYYKNNEVSKSIAQISKGKKVPYPDESYVHEKGGYFYWQQQKICSTQVLKLPGKHNIENACAAIASAWSWTQDKDAIEKGLSSFKGLPHRLKFVATKGEVDYYDDSIATTPGSTIAALKAFDQPKVAILGGSSKGSDFTQLATEMNNLFIKKVLLIGEEAQHIKKDLDKTGFTNYEVLSNVDMSDIVKRASELADSGDVVILSPACASFDMFKNYEARGNEFINEVENLET